MNTQYNIKSDTLSIYTLQKTPLHKGVFLKDPQHKDHIGHLCYKVQLEQPYIIEYTTSQSQFANECILHVVGTIISNRNPLSIGEGIYCEDNCGTYACIYRTDTSGRIYRSGDLVRCIIPASMCYDRIEGDQLAQIYIPNNRTQMPKQYEGKTIIEVI